MWPGVLRSGRCEILVGFLKQHPHHTSTTPGTNTGSRSTRRSLVNTETLSTPGDRALRLTHKPHNTPAQPTRIPPRGSHSWSIPLPQDNTRDQNPQQTQNGSMPGSGRVCSGSAAADLCWAGIGLMTAGSSLKAGVGLFLAAVAAVSALMGVGGASFAVMLVPWALRLCPSSMCTCGCGRENGVGREWWPTSTWVPACPSRRRCC